MNQPRYAAFVTESGSPAALSIQVDSLQISTYMGHGLDVIETHLCVWSANSRSLYQQTHDVEPARNLIA